MDPGMNNLLKWSIENTETTRNHATASPEVDAEPPVGRGLNEEAIRSLMGGPSDAELMKRSMAAIQSPDLSLDDKLVAFDNFEQLIEMVDNANNMESLALWSPLVAELGNSEAELRRMAAWCVGTAVQNNIKSQERALAVNAIPLLVKLALEDPNEQVRRKAIYGLSSEIRNYPPALQVLVQELPKELRPEGAINAGDMDEVDQVMNAIKQASGKNSKYNQTFEDDIMAPTRTVRSKFAASKTESSKGAKKSSLGSSGIKKSKSSKNPKPPPPKQQKTRPITRPAKRKKRVYTENELGLPKLNTIRPVGVDLPKGKKKGKVFVDDQESMMTILAIVNANKEGQIESKMMKSRQMEEIREARRKEAEARQEQRSSKLEERKDSLRRKRKNKSDSSAASELSQNQGRTLKSSTVSKKRVSFA
ncbi:MAG: hypothetical protein Q9224_001510 [Gallowayella concinna]